MRRLRAGVAAAVLIAVLLGVSTPGHGTAFNPLTGEESATAPLPPGVTVFLFHSGTGETRQAIRPGDVFTAFRNWTTGRHEVVGRIRIDAADGALCFRGVVLEGEIRQHDLVHAGSAHYLVIATDAPCRLEDGR